jgi:small redox-active disulfide protein 2
MKTIKVLGSGCSKCKVTYNNALEAVKQSGIEAEVIKVEDIMEMMKYDILSTPALVMDEKVRVKGRVADIKEIKDMLLE